MTPPAWLPRGRDAARSIGDIAEERKVTTRQVALRRTARAMVHDYQQTSWLDAA